MSVSIDSKAFKAGIRSVRDKVFFYSVMRAHGNGRIQSVIKVLQGRPYVEPRHWRKPKQDKKKVVKK